MNAPAAVREAPIITREMTIAGVQAESRTFDVVWSTGAPVTRKDWWSGSTYTETLSLDASAVRLDRLNSGDAPFLDNHDNWSTDSRFGVIVGGSATVNGKEGRATVRMLSAGIDPRADMIFAKIKDGVLRSVSVGYVVHTWSEIREGEALKAREAIDWEPYEISVVTIPADPQAGVRSASRLFACRIIPAGPGSHVRSYSTMSQSAPTPAHTGETPEVIARHTEFAIAARGLNMTEADAARAERTYLDAQAWRTAVIDARADAGRATHTSPAHVVRDERETRMAGIEEAMVAQLTGSKLDSQSNGARFMFCRNVVEFMAEAAGERRVPSGFGRREEFLRRAFHTTSDFPLLMENVLNKSLQVRYAKAEPTYRKIAKQRTYQDFRDHSTVRMGDFPTLQPVDPNGGEIKAGTFSESREKTRAEANGVRVNISRQLLVNDHLGGIESIINDRGAAVAQWEDNKFYDMMISGSSANGPTLLETSRQVFNTTDGSLAGTPSTIDVANISIGRQKLRERTSLDGQKLNVVATVLLVGPARETVAEQVVAPLVPALATSPNPFSGKLEVVVTAHIEDNAWYLFAGADVLPCFEWGLLDGYTAPRFRMEEVFGVQGTAMTLEHDFGCGAIDFRGGYRNAGA